MPRRKLKQRTVDAHGNRSYARFKYHEGEINTVNRQGICDEKYDKDDIENRDITKIAVFDLDGTLLRAHTPVLFIFYALRHGFLRVSSLPRIARWSFAYLLSLPRRPEEIRELMFSGFVGMSPDEVSPLFDEFVCEHVVKRLSQSAFDEVHARRESGCDAVLLTGSFTQIAERVADAMGFDAYCGTDMRIGDDGRYDGIVEGIVPEGYGKLYRLTEMCDEKYGKGGWCIAAAYGDHMSDRWLLERADEPVCVNGGKLKRYGSRRGWREESW